MKILSFIPWADRSPNISSCFLDSDTGHTQFDTSRLTEYKQDEFGLLVPKIEGSALCASLHNRIKAESPDEIVTYFELGLWRSRSQKSSIYPSEENGKAILRHTIDSPTGIINFVGQSPKVLTHEKITDVFGWEEVERTFDNFSAHLVDEGVWQRFCFSLCASYLAYDQHHKKDVDERNAAIREKEEAEQKAIEKHHQQEAKVAEAKRATTLEKLQSFDLR